LRTTAAPVENETGSAAMANENRDSKRTAVVTGGNRGLGFECCRQLAERGLTVVLTARDPRQAEDAARRLAGDAGDVVPHVLDVNDRASVEALVRFLEGQGSGVDVLVNNAGIMDGRDSRSIVDADLDAMQAIVETNTWGAIRVARALAPGMRARGYGRIVNVSSGLGQLSDMGAGWPGYRISKAALNAATRILAAEVAGTNVLVNAVSPGWARTDMGGAGAPRSAAEGAAGIVWAATLPDGGPTGGFFEDGKPLGW
jgi:NAD(P)-dependent dehydrogenase (short-subunit alcohol dehydrogenase family)